MEGKVIIGRRKRSRNKRNMRKKKREEKDCEKKKEKKWENTEMERKGRKSIHWRKEKIDK